MSDGSLHTKPQLCSRNYLKRSTLANGAMAYGAKFVQSRETAS